MWCFYTLLPVHIIFSANMSNLALYSLSPSFYLHPINYPLCISFSTIILHHLSAFFLGKPIYTTTILSSLFEDITNAFAMTTISSPFQLSAHAQMANMHKRSKATICKLKDDEETPMEKIMIATRNRWRCLGDFLELDGRKFLFQLTMSQTKTE